MSTRRLHAYFLLLVASIIWGVAGPIIKITLGEISTLPFLTYRFGLSTLAGIIIILVSKAKFKFDIPTILQIIVYSVLTSSISLGLLFWGMETTTVIGMSLITATIPLSIAITGYLFLREIITKKERVGMALAFLGTAVTIVGPSINGAISIGKLEGSFIIFLYVVVNALAVVILKKLLRKGVDPLYLTNIAFIIGFATIAPFSIYKLGLQNNLEILKNLSLSGHLGVIFMAFISGTLGYALSNLGQKTIEISEAAIFAYLTPVFSSILAIIWLKESITPVYILGAIAITAGVIIAEGKQRRYN